MCNCILYIDTVYIRYDTVFIDILYVYLLGKFQFKKSCVQDPKLHQPFSQLKIHENPKTLEAKPAGPPDVDVRVCLDPRALIHPKGVPGF
jgi:hypothetical protein